MLFRVATSMVVVEAAALMVVLDREVCPGSNARPQPPTRKIATPSAATHPQRLMAGHDRERKHPVWWIVGRVR
jgi:hypothetical protein